MKKIKVKFYKIENRTKTLVKELNLKRKSLLDIDSYIPSSISQNDYKLAYMESLSRTVNMYFRMQSTPPLFPWKKHGSEWEGREGIFDKY